MAKKEELQFEIGLLRDMHNYIINIGDEDIYEVWINTVPDEPSDEDLYYIADESESFHDVLQMFAELVTRSS